MKFFIRFLALLLFCVASGIAFFCYQQGWIIIRYPTSSTGITPIAPRAHKKTVSLYVWQHDAWYKESATLLWSQHDNAANIYLLVRRWLTLLEDEQKPEVPSVLQTAMLSPSGSIAYLSFDRNPLPTQASTFAQWHCIEGLLKTLRESGLPIAYVQILVHHQPLRDHLLDFSHPWPIEGFIKQ